MQNTFDFIEIQDTNLFRILLKTELTTSTAIKSLQYVFKLSVEIFATLYYHYRTRLLVYASEYV